MAVDDSSVSTVASRDSLEIMTDPEKSGGRVIDEKPDRTRSSSYAEDMHRAGLDDMVSHMMESRGRSGALFRRFDKANLRALLEMEREIAGLEERLEEEEGRRVVDEEVVGRLAGQLRKSMREYYETVLLTKEVMAISRPTNHTLNATRRAFPPDHGQSNFILAKYHNPFNFPDLCSVAPSRNSDLLTRIFEKFSEGRSVTHLVTFLSALCAVFFLVGGMVGLYFVESMRARLGLVGMFTVLFAAVIAGATDGRRHEVFVATAAYAAVLVVFVSGNIAANPSPTFCLLANADSNAANAGTDSMSTGSPLLNTAAAVTITAIETSTLTFSETGTMRTILSTITSTMSPTPTVILKKAEMSGLAKTGVGVGATIGALFILMLLGSFLVWVRKQAWPGVEGLFAVFARGRASNERGVRTGVRTVGQGGKSGLKKDGQNMSHGGIKRKNENEKGKEKAVVKTREREAHVVWV